MSLTIEELTKLANELVVTPEMIDSLNKILRAAEAEFEEKERVQRLAMADFLDRRYTI